MTKKQIEKINVLLTGFERLYWNAKADERWNDFARIANTMDGMAIVLRELGYSVTNGFDTDGAYARLERLTRKGG